MIRQSRKLEHIQYAMQLAKQEEPWEIADISLVHRCLPELKLDEISIHTQVAGFQMRSPIIINAITGGAKDVKNINAALATVAKECQLAMAVGSQMAALEDPSVADTFKIVRQINPDGIVFANIGAYASPDLAQRAIEMIEADALQIHLNAPQELVMHEGDRDFRDWLTKIAAIVQSAHVPVIVKEVGFGISMEDARLLQDNGVTVLDVGGKGGTNFVAIECERKQDWRDCIYRDWGIPTPVSLVEVLTVADPLTDVIASGGLKNGLDVAKMLALGAKAVGIAGIILQELQAGGSTKVVEKIKAIESELKMAMLLAGAKDIKTLQQVPVIITGFTAEWLSRRGIDLKSYAMRKII